MRLIDADALVAKFKAYKKLFLDGWGGFCNLPENDKARIDELDNCIAQAFNASTIDAVEVVHGRWRRVFDDSGGWVDMCSECKEFGDNTPYCPNCGADMRPDAPKDGE